jgi:hypothetical protein
VSLTVVVAICAPIAAAVAVRTPLHLLLMWHRIRDRRRYYVKSFAPRSERYAARVHAAALWTALPSRNERGASARFRPEDDLPDTSPAAAAATIPSGSTAGHESNPDAVVTASYADKTALVAASELNFSPRRTRPPTHATHVRVSAEKGRAFAFAFAFIVAVVAIAGGFIATKGWCAAAQRRYNVALVVALVVDALVVSPLWVGAVYAYRVLMAEPRVVTSRRPDGLSVSSSVTAPSPATTSSPGGRSSRRTQETTAVVAQVLHEPYPVHNAWRVASSS